MSRTFLIIALIMLIFGASLLLIVLFSGRTVINTCQFNVASARNVTETQGQWGLFRGSIDDIEYYYIFEDTGDSKIRRYLPADITYIHETNEQPYAVINMGDSWVKEKHLQKYKEERSGLQGHSYYSDNIISIHLYVPPGTVIEKFEIR